LRSSHAAVALYELSIIRIANQGSQGASQFLAELFFSLAPGFSRVNRARRKWERFQLFSAPAATKPLKRLGAASPAPTGLKPGANERLQESEMRPGQRFAGPCLTEKGRALQCSGLREAF
jgi:hypothetical protein